MFTRLRNKVFSISPSVMLTLILGPCFIAYGIGIAFGYRSSLIKILGLPELFYAGMFVVAGLLKLCGAVFHWGRVSHTIGVTVASFWAMVIIVLVPSTAAGFAGALPWIAIALIALVAAIWPWPIDYVRNGQKPALRFDRTDPTQRAIEVTRPIVEKERNGYNDRIPT